MLFVEDEALSYQYMWVCFFVLLVGTLFQFRLEQKKPKGHFAGPRIGAHNHVLLLAR